MWYNGHFELFHVLMEEFFQKLPYKYDTATAKGRIFHQTQLYPLKAKTSRLHARLILGVYETL